MPICFWRSRRRVALFGGSFNPPHIGHSAICRWLISGDLVDYIWVIPCYVHPFDKELADFDHRLAMCKLAMGKHLLPITTLDIERKLGGVSHTLRTIRHLKEAYPKVNFFLVRGGDVQEQSHEWYKFDEVEKLVNIIDIPRSEDSPIPNISSTDIRRRIVNGEQYKDLVEREVAVYIITKGLYV